MNEFCKSIPKCDTIQKGNTPIQYINNINDIEEIDIFNDIEEPQFIKDMANNIDKNLELLQNKFSDSVLIPTPTNESEIVKNNFNNKTYHIFDMFWLNYEGNESIENNKNLVEFVIISYNIDFGNLRISFYQIPNNAIDENIIFNQSLKLLVAGTIYPSSAFKAMNYFEPFTCIEQLIIRNNEKWERERPIIAMFNDVKENNIKLKITNIITKEDYYYVFQNWQKKAFEECLKFTYKKGMSLRGQLNIYN